MANSNENPKKGFFDRVSENLEALIKTGHPIEYDFGVHGDTYRSLPKEVENYDGRSRFDDGTS